jgi:hypothetical protein
VIANPSVVSTDKSDNWSDQTVTTSFTVGYKSTKTDKTVWQTGWGFELSASYTASCDIPFVGGMSFTASTTVSYDGSEGEEHTVSEEQNIQETKEFPCPPRSRCLFKLITRKLDNVDMPFEATVQRNTEVRVMGNCNSNCSNIEICNNNVNYNGNHPEVYLLQAIHQ